MRTDIYTDDQLRTIAALPEEWFLKILHGKSYNNLIAMRKLMQKSLSVFSKHYPKEMNVQMDIVRKCQLIEKIVRPIITKYHASKLALRYPNITSQQLEELLKDKTEKQIARESY